MTMYHLMNDMSDATMSRHRTLKAAIIARTKHARRIRKSSGGSSFLPMSVTINGEDPVDPREYDEVLFSLYFAGKI